jgi:acetolactate synthase-1/2/3 large subunit
MLNTLKLPQTDVLQTKTESISGSEVVMKAFLAEGVDTIFGYPRWSNHAHL